MIFYAFISQWYDADRFFFRWVGHVRMKEGKMILLQILFRWYHHKRCRWFWCNFVIWQSLAIQFDKFWKSHSHHPPGKGLIHILTWKIEQRTSKRLYPFLLFKTHLKRNQISDTYNRHIIYVKSMRKLFIALHAIQKFTRSRSPINVKHLYCPS